MRPDTLTPVPLTQNKFFKFGDVLETNGRNHFLINDGMCKRYDQLSEVIIDEGVGKPIVSIFSSKI